MPQLLGKRIANPNETIADSLGSVGESMFRPVDPVTRERLSQAERQRASRANAVDALRRATCRNIGRNQFWQISLAPTR
jgi:hypothetical protein